MSSKSASKSSAGDAIKWIIAILLLSGGVIANYYFNELAWSLRLAGWIVLGALSGAVLAQTQKGKRFLTFVKESRAELRRVVWPTREETVRFTIGVVVMVMIMALALWLIDTALLWIVKWFTR